MTTEKGCRKDKNQNIQVFVRLRPLNQRERDIKSLGVVEVVNGREVVVRQSQQTAHTKRFTFDRAFPPGSKQVEVYQEVVSPLIEEVLSGYNCTVFAYGQTGTGKTHTMVGESAANETSWQNDPLAGIIPRALSQLFDELRISNTEYTVRVSYLELYNEELFDLLSTSEDNSKLRIYEDVTRKGSNIVNGLEEITVYNKTEVYKIMAQGQERKRVASTLMNAQSSRSHTVFTIVVHMKENSAEGEELVKIGKLNLVDLAGSENISKAGSDNPAKRERARECVNINQSLLTLGRVITALVERHPHIPYRESKLTRILQESLGGRTKTSIIATISPGHKDLEETMSTLEYANRAKNIQNKPEVNQKMTKKAILKEYAEEIDRLKRDLQAARDKNGVYLANETFAEMTLKQEEQRKEIQELLLKKRAMEEERERMESIFAELSQKLEQKETELNSTVNKLSSTRNKLITTSKMLQTTKLHFEESRYIVSKQQETENALTEQAKQILATAHAAAAAAAHLHDNVDKRRNIESANLEITKTYRDISAQHRGNIANGLDNYVGALTKTVDDIQTMLESFTAESTGSCADSKLKLEQLAQAAMEMTNRISSLKATASSHLTSVVDSHAVGSVAALQQHSANVEASLHALAQCVLACWRRCDSRDVGRRLRAWLPSVRETISTNLSALRASHESFKQDVERGIARRALTARRQTCARHEECEAHTLEISQRIQTIQSYKEDTDKRLAQKLQDIETERTETEKRLEMWIAQEKKHLEEKLQKRIQEIEAERLTFEKRVSDELDMLNSLLQKNRKSGEVATEDMQLNVAEAEDDLHNVQKFAEACDKGCNTVSADVATLLDKTLSVVEEVKTEIMQELGSTRDEVAEESKKQIELNAESTKQISESTQQFLSSLVQHCQTALDTVVDQVNENNTSTVQHLASLSSTASGLAEAVTSHRGLQGRALGGLQRGLEQLYHGVRREVDSLTELEARCLSQEYAVYSPTGSTPVRAEYGCARALAATSPHHRLLARFRAMRSNAHDDDCIVVESENESRASDTESSEASEDSAVASVCPSPPVGPQPINKCSSETDIYASHRQHEGGKENASRSMCFKKPSKLPALSAKKPLVSRNDNSQ